MDVVAFRESILSGKVFLIVVACENGESKRRDECESIRRSMEIVDSYVKESRKEERSEKRREEKHTKKP